MARPERNNVDYFPFLCEDGKKMFYLEQTYGNDGFSTFVKLLRELAKTDYHYLNLSNKSTLMFLSAKCKISVEVLESIIKDLVNLGKFNAMLWNENKVIWCQDFTDSIKDAYKKRNNECITFEGLLSLLISLGIRKQSKSKSIAPVNTQTIVEYSKLKEITNISKVVPTSELDIDFDKFIEVFNSIGNRKFKLSESIKRSLIARLKVYTKAELFTSFKNAHKNKFHVENKFQYLTPIFLLKEESIEKYLNAPVDEFDGKTIYSPIMTN